MNAYLHCLSHTPLVGYVDPEQAVLDEVNGTIADARLSVGSNVFNFSASAGTERRENYHGLVGRFALRLSF